MKTLPFILVVFLPFAAAIAQDTTRYQCSIDEVTRRVEVLSEPGVSVPCEVHYYKDTEMPGEDQVLWSAQNEEGYCEARAAEFVAKLEGMGWTCWDAGAGAAEADDTTDLAPAEEDIEISDAEADDPR
jgi:hypothetical protein